ncbi:MAG: DtxR family transcriptional regulator [Planctomycetota bacterium]|nr:MAG: DtxR family transcriptional regulator [Planctomycetota bacterium]
MTAIKDNNLSASLEDYLEAIFNLAGASNVARSKDIAKSLGVARSSVTGALRVLKKKGLANYRPYDYVTLTKAGQDIAAEVVRKHNIITSFFVNVLGVETDIAQQAACRAEHTLGPEVISKLLCFIGFVNKNSKNGYDLADEFKRFCKSRPQNNSFSGKQMSSTVGLDEVKPGQKCKIVRIIGRSGVNKRIADMGVVPGTILEVQRVAPLGDPIDVKLKGYRLSLRKEEASKIMVELGQSE